LKQRKLRSKLQFHENEIEAVFQKLISYWDELIEFYNREVKFEYEKESDRLIYIDMADISRFIANKKLSGEVEYFEIFFENVETIFTNADETVRNLIVVGLFEDIQNIGGKEIDYYRSFDQWLKPNSLKAWRTLIDFWEGKDWKKTNESQAILNNKNKANDS